MWTPYRCPNVDTVSTLGTVFIKCILTVLSVLLSLLFIFSMVKSKAKQQEKGVHARHWNEKDVTEAVKAVVMGKMPKKAAAKLYHIPKTTLLRYLQKIERGDGITFSLGRPTVLSSEQEEELVAHILNMESRLYGLTPTDVRSLVYEFCKLNGIAHKFSNGTVGKKWMIKFMKRHPELSLRKPEAVSMQRVLGFNKSKVSRFFDILHETLLTNQSDAGVGLIKPENIYNVDESGFTICQKPRKIIALKGKKSVGAITSAEKGKNITVVCCISASGSYVPPMFIFPRVRIPVDFLDDLPVGSIAKGNPSGWISEPLFLDWFRHFINFVQPKQRIEPTLLLMDGHCSHTRNLELIKVAKENNVSILVFPSHCTHRLQPLDVAVFKSMNSYYDTEV